MTLFYCVSYEYIEGDFKHYFIWFVTLFPRENKSFITIIIIIIITVKYRLTSVSSPLGVSDPGLELLAGYKFSMDNYMQKPAY